MPKATVNGIEIAYEVQGTGTPVLFIHGGWGGPATSLVPADLAVARALGDDVTLISFDRRSAGLSQYVLDEFTVKDIAADARALLAHLGIDRSVVIGHSMGGMVALQYAFDYPHHVIGLCLAGTGANLMPDIDLGRAGSALVARCKSEGDRAVFDSLKDTLRAAPVVSPAEPRPAEAMRRLEQRNEVVAKALKDVSEADLYRYWLGSVRNYNAFIGHDFTARLREIKMPALVIHGSGDTIVPEQYGKALHSGIAGSEFCELDGGGHGVFDYPRAHDALRAWVSKVGRSAVPA
ncbi:MAG: alpha/beta hydrolase [Dehalococcoidia bacterium]|nr:alpha/beta hydrolase [Dehalococcoidia bacterium]